MKFHAHTANTAPEKSKPVLRMIEQTYGFIPNLAAVIAESPGTFNYLSAAMGAFDGPDMELSPLERQVALIAVSVANRCVYCTAAHSMLASKSGMSQSDIEAIQDGQPISNSKLEALRKFAEHVVEACGWVEPGALKAFEEAGYRAAHVLEVVAAVSLKTLTNYANHIAQPKVNDQFVPFIPKWETTLA